LAGGVSRVGRGGVARRCRGTPIVVSTNRQMARSPGTGGKRRAHPPPSSQLS
jgi:hypothetical protein